MGAPALPEVLTEPLPTSEVASTTALDIDAGLEPKVLVSYNLHLPSEIVKGVLSHIDPLQQYVAKEVQSLGPSKKFKTPQRETSIERTMETLLTYNKTLKSIQEYSSKIVPTHTNRKGKKCTETSKEG